MTNCSARCLPLLIAMSFLLGGCFVSEQPRFPLSGAAAPFGEGGRYVVFAREGDGRYRRSELFVIKRQADRAYEFKNEKGEALTISLHALGGDRFVGQARPDDKPGYGYVVWQVQGNEALLFAPQCSDQDKAALVSLGIAMKGQHECIIDRVADPVGLFRQVALGEPVSKLVREQP